MIDLSINKQALERNIRLAKENGIVIPTFAQMTHPNENVPESVKSRLSAVSLWDVNPLNLFRITWKNRPFEKSGLFGGPNYIELPPELTGVQARILCLVGKYFPTGCHKVGASFGCLVPRLVTGQFDASRQKAVWPSTGNYCRGGAFNSKLLACQSVAILPQGMSRERFSWLSQIAGEVIATPGTESNVKEIFDKTNELKAMRDDVTIFNQFEEMGNYLWHYTVTGLAIAETFEAVKEPGSRFAGICLTSGSGGTLASGDYLKQRYPGLRIAVGEALQCPTILNNGFGAHRIEGIGDKHIPWIHNVRNTDMAIAIDDNDAMALLRLFNEPAGRQVLSAAGLTPDQLNALSLFGISGIANLLCAIKFAKYYSLGSDDIIFTVLTDSAEMYGSRVEELRNDKGDYESSTATVDYNRRLLGMSTDHMLEMGIAERKRVHNLKYYTWIEQQGKEVHALDALWNEDGNTFSAVQKQAGQIDALIDEFNEASGVLKKI